MENSELRWVVSGSVCVCVCACECERKKESKLKSNTNLSSNKLVLLLVPIDEICVDVVCQRIVVQNLEFHTTVVVGLDVGEAILGHVFLREV